MISQLGFQRFRQLLFFGEYAEKASCHDPKILHMSKTCHYTQNGVFFLALFLVFFRIFTSTEMPFQRAKIKIAKSESMENVQSCESIQKWTLMF